MARVWKQLPISGTSQYLLVLDGTAGGFNGELEPAVFVDPDDASIIAKVTTSMPSAGAAGIVTYLAVMPFPATDSILRLDAGKTIGGVAGTASAVNIVLSGYTRDSATGAALNKKLYQGVLPNTAVTLYTSTGIETVVTTIALDNTTGSDVAGVSLFLDGTATASRIGGTITVPANGSAMLTAEGWKIFNAMGTPVT